MEQLTKIGRAFYGIGIIAIAVHQLLMRDFRSEILSPFPAWPHQYFGFPILTTVALVFAGVLISGLIKVKFVSTRDVCLYLGFGFLAICVISHLPYIFFFSPYTAMRLDVWFGIGEALAFGGGAFVMAGSFSESSLDTRNSFQSFLEKLVPFGRIFFCILILLFAASHFIFATFVSTMVPKWIGPPMFWTYFVGVLLICAGVAIILKIWIRPVAFLLAIMLFLFLLLFHIPEAIAKPFEGHGNEIVRSFVALMFCGIAMVIGTTNGAFNRKAR